MNNTNDIEFDGRIIPNGKIRFGGHTYVVKKVDHNKKRILLHGFGFRKWYSFEEISKFLQNGGAE